MAVPSPSPNERVVELREEGHVNGNASAARRHAGVRTCLLGVFCGGASVGGHMFEQLVISTFLSTRRVGGA